MPTQLPAEHRRHGSRRLTFSQTAVFLVLIVRLRILDMCLSAFYGRADWRGREPHGPTLLGLVRRWLAIHERIAALLLGILVPPHIQEVRDIFEMFAAERSVR